MSHHAKARWKLILNIVTLFALIFLVYSIRDQIIDSLKNLAEVNAVVLPLIVVWQGLNYHAYTSQMLGVLHILGNKISYKKLYKINLELTFVNHVFPSGGVSGFSYFSLQLKDEKISATRASLVQLLRFILVFIAMQLLIFFALISLAIGGQANNFVLLVGGMLSTFILISTVFLAYVVGSQKRINTFFITATRVLNRLIYVVRTRHPETINIEKARKRTEELHDNFMLIKNDYGVLKKPLLWSLVASITELLTLYTVYVAFGFWVNPGAVILAYAVANFAGFFSVLPGGVGIYEALMTATLAASGVPAAVSLPVTVMYRILSMAVQLPPGYYLYYKRLRAKPNPEIA